MSVFTLSLVLFLIMDPIGSVSAYMKMIGGFSGKKRTVILIREMLFVLLAAVIFSYFGDFFFTFLGISEVTARIASGVILFLVALSILFPTGKYAREKVPVNEEPFLIPLAIPLIAGPAYLATVMLYSHMILSQAVVFQGIFYSWLVCLAVLFFAPQLKRILGENGLMACEKLMGMILILLATQRFLDGVKTFVAAL